MNFGKIQGIWFLLSGIVYVVGLIVCIVLATQNFTLGFGSGGALVLLNTWASARKVKGVEFINRPRATASLLLGFYLRLIVVGLCLFLLIKFLRVDPLGLVTGLSVVPAGLIGMLIMIYVANRRPEEV